MIDREELLQLRKDSVLLQALRDRGVENWDGFEEAAESAEAEYENLGFDEEAEMADEAEEVEDENSDEYDNSGDID